MVAAVTFDHVSKRFALQHTRATSLLESITHVFQRPERLQEEFWVLQDVSFQLDPGQTVGFIGSNGAGKSTALKLISRIIEPSSGKVSVTGRVGALLELGAGFHPDLTGRENVYLNGSILGLRYSQIQTKLDDIVDFSELERFIDMPIRNYSSGMLVRLGFAVATSFLPDILLVDEVLAVGDQVFQSRCLKRIREIQESGTTVVVVSHDLSVIRRMCQRVIWLEDGGIKADGEADDTINHYLEWVWSNQTMQHDKEEYADKRRWGSGEVRIRSVTLTGQEGNAKNVFMTGGKFSVRMSYACAEPVSNPAFGIGLYDEFGNYVNGPNMIWSGVPLKSIDGRGYVEYTVDNLPLLPGRYSLTVAVYDQHIKQPYDHWHQMANFMVIPSDLEQQDGIVYIPCRWLHSNDRPSVVDGKSS